MHPCHALQSSQMQYVAGDRERWWRHVLKSGITAAAVQDRQILTWLHVPGSSDTTTQMQDVVSNISTLLRSVAGQPARGIDSCWLCRHLRYKGICLLSTLWVLLMLLLSQNNHVGGRMIAAAAVVGCTWIGVLVGGSMVGTPWGQTSGSIVWCVLLGLWHRLCAAGLDGTASPAFGGVHSCPQASVHIWASSLLRSTSAAALPPASMPDAYCTAPVHLTGSLVARTSLAALETT